MIPYEGQSSKIVKSVKIVLDKSFELRNIKEIQLIHSFIPPDRVFGQIEQRIKKKEMILNPDELLRIIGEHGEVIILRE